MKKQITTQLPPSLIDQLPSYKSAIYQPPQYEDSTHELWLLKSKQANMFLKVCNNTSSQFWQVMKMLFGLNLHMEIVNFPQLYAFLNENTYLEIPTLIKAKTTNLKTQNDDAFILTSEVKGTVVTDVNSHMVSQLAQHLSQLHQQKQVKWGTLITPVFNNKQWGEKLSETLLYFSKQQGIPKKYLDKALTACQYATHTTFVPLMPDLRWDQFLQQDEEISALIDLDAFVLAPRELDFVLLEYILTTEQHSKFIQTYASTHSISDISEIRPAYRLLLFLMQVLGEQDIEKWMKSEQHF